MYNGSLIFLFSSDLRRKTEWAEGVDVVAKTNLEKPLLVRERKDSHDLIRVNFNPNVSVIMRMIIVVIVSE